MGSCENSFYSRRCLYGGVMEYGEAVRIAFETCKLLQENFSSWDDMVGSYTLGYQLWRGKRKTDRQA